jgi:CubicO group peptidase (beta-lactamase class C family)
VPGVQQIMGLQMNIRKLLFPSLLVCAILALIRRAFARPAPAKQVANNATFDAIDTYIEGEMRRLKIPGVSLAIIEGDQIVHTHGFGNALPGGGPPTPQTPFYIGSVTKSITALAVMQLVESGKIELDAPVQRYLPWFRMADPRASARITVRHLLNQTSGIPSSAGEMALADFDYRPGAAERHAHSLAAIEPAHPVGSVWEYSNSNYILLGLILEAASGESWSNYLEEHIFKPLGMSHTYAPHAMQEQRGLAVGHQLWFGIPFRADSLPIPICAFAGGGLISTAEDLSRYMIALLNGGRFGDVQILSSAGIEELQRQAIEHQQMNITFGYAMGWFLSEMEGMTLIWHSGTVPHYGAYVGLLPEQKKGIVLLFNACHYWMTPLMGDFGGSTAALLAGKQPKPNVALRLIPWILRAQLLVPVLQMAGLVSTFRRLRRWEWHPDQRPHGGWAWVRHLLIPLMPNFLLARIFGPMLVKNRAYLRIYMPDTFWLAAISGGFALTWSLVRTRLILKALGGRSSRNAL